jgi:hypothetical protein
MAIVGASACLGGPAFAGALADKDSRGTLSVEYRYESSGSHKNQQVYEGSNLHPPAFDVREWRTSRTARLTIEVTAEAPQSMSSTQAPDAAQSAESRSQQDHAMAAMQKMGPMMADMQGIYAKCGADQACIQQAVTGYANSGKVTPGVMSARSDISAAGKSGPARFQSWRATSLKGTYEVDETLHTSVDGTAERPACLAATGKRCTREESRKGSGEVPPPGGAGAAAGMASIEVDATKNTLTIQLPAAIAGLPVTETVTDSAGGKGGGAHPSTVLIPGLSSLKPISASGDWHQQSGQQVIKVAGENGNAGTLTVSWKFSAAR